MTPTVNEPGHSWSGKDLTKLPQWARDLIQHQQRLLASARHSAEEARLATNPDESDTLIYRFQQDPIGLGHGTKVAFLLNDTWASASGRSGMGDIQAHVQDGQLLIHGFDVISVHPKSGNSIAITLRK